MLCNLDIVETLYSGAAILTVEAVANPVNGWSTFKVWVSLESSNCSWARIGDGQITYSRAQDEANEHSGEREKVRKHHGSDNISSRHIQRCSLERYLCSAMTMKRSGSRTQHALFPTRPSGFVASDIFHGTRIARRDHLIGTGIASGMSRGQFMGS